MTMSKRRTALVAVLGLIVAAALVMAIATLAPVGPVAWGVAPGASDDRPWLAVAPGRVEALSGQIRIAAPVAGLVDKVLVKANDIVFAGEPLIRIADEELKARLAAMQAQVEVRKRARDQARASGKADDRRDAEDAVADAEAAVREAQVALDRAAAEWRANSGPGAAVIGARSELARARDQLTKRLEELRKVEANAPLLTATEGQLAVARADAATARAALDKMTIRAPIDGTVLQVNARAGELAVPGATQPLVMLANVSALRVRAELDERDLAAIKVGQAVTVRARGIPRTRVRGETSPRSRRWSSQAVSMRAHCAARPTSTSCEVMVELARPGPLTIGMKSDVYFHAGK